MARQTVLEALVVAKGNKTRVVTKERVMKLAHAAARLLVTAVTKQPSLLPLQEVLSGLMAPAGDEAPTMKEGLARLRRLKRRLMTATDKEAVQLREQIARLIEFLTDDH